MVHADRRRVDRSPEIVGYSSTSETTSSSEKGVDICISDRFDSTMISMIEAIGRELV